MQNITIEITISDASYLIDYINLIVKTKVPEENKTEMMKEIKDVIEETIIKAISVM